MTLTEATARTLVVPGATLTYDVRPGGDAGAPPLFLIGSPMGAAGFVTLAGHFPDRAVVTSGRPLRAVPSVEERLPEIATASFWRGRALGTSVIGLLASVGCPYRCDFCTDWNNPYETLSLDDLARDLRWVRTRFPSTKVAFHDPNRISANQSGRGSGSWAASPSAFMSM